MPTLFTDPRSGGVKKSSGVNVLPIVADTWAQIRDDKNTDVDYLIASFDGSSKTDITVISSGAGGVEACAAALLENKACYGGIRLRRNGRFVTFFYVPEGCPPLQRGRASMFKNGVLNVLEGSDNEIDMRPGLTEDKC
mmetsp:Transcript_28824/g.45413  ORF Transcript_28824/g.45413 Transcript_28824/m.45413 type:complete len:138 (+) Transcript_28824:69-482(+)|eukprot:CAMPEP_0201721428 /NCGR_PEP_ID=MMETSP0593-20130828/6105_1 /ASSEMBLY_ACC=CAM_ASM_000672 /TAXON_ID=267983 /ORGANISM="Skeletonema japonicum, Strain CCMP2506" /LENGTH=137 /DNA_ID=CAMNT_0048212251 /DNA_START=57 /DNA_END=470 /DNA_ORIENTATION=-